MTNVRKDILPKGAIIPMTFDYMFTDIFNASSNISILENLVYVFTDIPYEKIKGNLEVRPRELELNNKKERSSQVDLILDLGDEKINIELNNSGSIGVKERNIVYACKVHGSQLKYGDKNYQKIGKTLQISFNTIACNKENICDSYHLRNENGDILSEKIKIIMVDMVKDKKVCYNKKEEYQARWCRALKATSEKEIRKAIGKDMMSKDMSDKLVEEIKKRSEDEEVIALYTKYSKEEMEKNTLIAEARDEGKKENTIEIATNFKKAGIDLKIISENTGLSIEEINKL